MILAADRLVDLDRERIVVEWVPEGPPWGSESRDSRELARLREAVHALRATREAEK